MKSLISKGKRLLLVVLDAADSVFYAIHVCSMVLLLPRDCSSDHEHRNYSKQVETHIRGLRALGVSTERLLVSLLVNKLPPEIRLIVTRVSATGTWNLIDVMSVLEQEVDARECASAGSMFLPPCRLQTRLPTGATLFASNPASNNEPFCVYCGQRHTSNHY